MSEKVICEKYEKCIHINCLHHNWHTKNDACLTRECIQQAITVKCISKKKFIIDLDE